MRSRDDQKYSRIKPAEQQVDRWRKYHSGRTNAPSQYTTSQRALRNLQRISGSLPSVQMRITAAEPGKVNFELPIEKQHTNRLGILHGATLATMVDTSGSLALASRGLYSTGVSTDLNVTYLNAGGKIGDLIKGEVICDKFGKTLAYTSVKFMNKNNEIVARGSHTKFVALAWKDERNITGELEPEVSESQAREVTRTSFK
ncbi:uncharacterized protein Z519_10468 [Cladophialophora bantiana CBS 173.52]|uniref:Thioesterase domain-containing protein n=1 Tax=Cladophialophora bantiana (strain ATCC 10958 / CBS 173.52 / CDC B-1940 / NIH 8579) TaxID=1442370 RepID=A0A0D2HWS2_CLAB1|nr:uncharacterized protein Z519_10468 [Cladophialophora bantiana CBS 173.52]KIW88984.1 hypothetical protein Z519_10468 [Cladophialophora bantiana CBS 173.52]